MSSTGAGRVDDRKFGWQLGVGFGILTGVALWRGWWAWLTASFGALALVLLLGAAFAPGLLGPINRAWMGLSHALSKIISPIVLFVMFVVLITPVAVIMRLRRRDALRLKRSRESSFWIPRESGIIEPASFARQY